MKFIRSKFKMKTMFLNNAGQSLMEVVVALGVVLFVLISIVVLVLINSFGQKESENKVIATNLVREGIEVVRSLRDTAKLQKKDITNFSYTYHYYYPSFDSANNTWTLNACTQDANACNWGSQTEIKYDTTNKIYSNSGSYTIFKRRINIDSICGDDTDCTDGVDDYLGDCSYCPDDPSQGGINPMIKGYRITSVVRWLENNQQVNFELVDFLYDWR